MKRFFFGCSCFTDFGLLVLRIGMGLSMALAHGWGKFQMMTSGEASGLVAGITKLGFPAPMLFAWLIALTELVAALLIAIGLLTRPAALALAIGMGVAFFGAHGADPFSTKELAYVYLIFAIAIFFTSAGRYSLDAMFSKKSSV